MDDRQSSNKSPRFDLRTNPFHCLAVHPTATDKEIQEGYEAAKPTALVPAAVLQLAYDTLLDPVSRLFVELNYLIDSSATDIAATYAILSQDTAAAEVVDFAKHLAPLSRANLIAHAGATGSADGGILSALVEAHALLDVGSIYATLKAIRAKADRAASSLLSVDQCLKALLHAHARAVVASYPGLTEAAAPLLACARTTCAGRDPYRQEALQRLLSVYEDALGSQPAELAARIVSACDALSRRPADALPLNEMTTALNLWALLSGPLIVRDASQACDSQEAGMMVERLRALIENVATDQHGDVAICLADVVRHAFSEIAQSVGPIANDLSQIEHLALDLKLTPLAAFLDRADSLPALAADLNKTGFGPQSVGHAHQLWMIFLKTVTDTTSEQPWFLVGDFANDLGAHLYHDAALALLAGLTRHGEQTSIDDAILSSLRGNLQRLERRDGTSQKDEGHRKMAQTPHPMPTKANRWLPAALVAAFLMTGLGAAVYLYSTKLHRAAVSPHSVADRTSTGEAETIPPVGTGQHLELSAVRYCHYQEERLKLMKPDIQGPEAVRTFNLLVVDYNSRCSDFFYKDSDLAMVMGELVANRARLAAEAKQLISAGTDHSAVNLSTPAGKQDTPPN
jgi:hypothetical protein